MSAHIIFRIVPIGLSQFLKYWARSRGAFARPNVSVICSSAVVYALLTAWTPALMAANIPITAPPRSFFYTITHLHPAAYVIFFIVFALSVLNLFAQGWLSFETGPLSKAARALGFIEAFQEGGFKGSRSVQRTAAEEPGDVIIGVKRSLNTDGRVSKPRILTPLDGVDHPLPSFGTNTGQMGAPRILENSPKKNSLSEFKFSAAVDVPSSEELDRRNKEQIVVHGSVKGPDDKGIGSVIVYLTDEKGVRLGQSCRSMQETGEFKVLINELGKYAINAYKRGYIMESSDQLAIPIESGKIEGFSIKMIPEGCVLHGKVISEETGAGIPNLDIKCVCGTVGFTRNGRTGEAGEFKIQGVPVNSKCCVEIFGSDGQPLAVSENFETVQKKEIHTEIIISKTDAAVSKDAGHAEPKLRNKVDDVGDDLQHKMPSSAGDD